MLTVPQPNPDAADCSPRFTVHQEAQRTVIQLKAVRLPLGERVGRPIFLTIWFLCLGVFTALEFWSWLRGDPNSSRSDLFIIVPLWMAGLALFRWHVCRVRRSAILIVTPDGLTISESGFWGRREHHWSRVDIVGVRYEERGARIQLVPRIGRPVRVIRDIYEWDSRWLVATLQDLLKIGLVA